MENSSASKRIPNIFGTVVFFITFIPYILIVKAGISGINFGFGQGFGHFTGADGMFLAAFELLFTGIIPFCLIYQIKFGKNVISKYKLLKTAAALLAGLSVISLILTIPVSKAYQKSIINKEPERITEYLSGKYGEEMAKDITIEFDCEKDSTFRYYNVSTPVLPDGCTFKVRVDLFKNNRLNDYLVSEFMQANISFNEDCNAFIKEKYNLPDNYTISGSPYSIDFGNYRYGDNYMDLLDRTEYSIKKININASEVDEDKAKQYIKEVWENKYFKEQIKNCDTSLLVNIDLNGHNEYTAYIFSTGDPDTVKVSLYNPPNYSYCISEYKIK